MNDISNKSTVLEFYKCVVRDRNSALIDTYIHDQYIQHSPSLKGGKEGLLEAIEFLKQLPESKETTSPLIMAIEDNGFVVTILNIVFMGLRKWVVDVFRLEKGKVAEHWDAVQEMPFNEEEANTGMMSVQDRESTEQNKFLVRRFLEHSVRDLVNAEEYLSANYREHERHGFQRDSIAKIQNIFGEGNLVMVQSTGESEKKPVAVYDLFKVLHNQIDEHWRVKQEIPEIMPHDNGMV